MRCPAYNSPLSGDVRWCPYCLRSVSFPQIGKLTSPSRRLGAFLIDYAISTAFEMPLRVTKIVESRAFAAAALLIFAVWTIAFLFILARGTTLGKMLLGLYVYRHDGKRAGFFRKLSRESIGKTVSTVVFFLVCSGSYGTKRSRADTISFSARTRSRSRNDRRTGAASPTAEFLLFFLSRITLMRTYSERQVAAVKA